MFGAFKLHFVVDILAFLAWQILGQLFEKLGDFFQIIWSPCLDLTVIMILTFNPKCIKPLLYLIKGERERYLRPGPFGYLVGYKDREHVLPWSLNKNYREKLRLRCERILELNL
jgi:hypothetical protein